MNNRVGVLHRDFLRNTKVQLIVVSVTGAVPAVKDYTFDRQARKSKRNGQKVGEKAAFTVGRLLHK